MTSASAIDGGIQRKTRGREARAINRARAVRVGKGTTLVISNGDMNDIIRTIKSLKNVGVLIDVVSVTVNHEIKRQVEGFLNTIW